MASYETAIQTIDFVSRHSISGPTTQRKQNMESSRKYILRQTSPNTQTLESTSPPTSEAPPVSYNIKSNPKGGFMNRHPHMIITNHEGGLNLHLAEVRFEIYGYGTTIAYKEAGISQSLFLEHRRKHQYKVSIDGIDHRWQPLGPSQEVLELTKDAGKKVALFVYAEEVPQRRASAPASLEHFEAEDVGEIHIMDEFEGGQLTLEQILCTAVVVVERAKRRATNTGLASWESVSSKKHYFGRRESRSESDGPASPSSSS